MLLPLLLLLLGCCTGSAEWRVACPTEGDWLQTQDNCYTLSWLLANRSEAEAGCRHRQSVLLDVKDRAELGSVVVWLNRLQQHQTEWLQPWHTSGARADTGIWEWLSDGTRLDVHSLRLPPNPGQHNNLLFLQPINDTHQWFVGTDALLGGAICKWSRQPYERAGHKYSGPPETYGVASGGRLHQLHPSIVSQPRDVVLATDEAGDVHFASNDESSALQCAVAGRPAPDVTWHRGTQPIAFNSSRTGRVVQVNGQLVFHNAGDTEFDTYHCVAANQFGKARSLQAQLQHGYIGSFAKSRLDVYAQLGSSKALTCQPPSHHPRSLSYTWTFGGSVENFVVQDERKFIASDGTLYFAHLRPEDENEYSCSVVSELLQAGHYGPFFRLVLTNSTSQGQPQRDARPTIPSEFIRVYPPEPMYGDRVKLECFSYGRPSPTYEWRRVGKRSLGDGSQALNHGRVLVIQRLGLQHLGTYQCVATNPLGSAMAQTTLHANSAPIMQSLAVSARVVSVNSTVTLTCRVHSEPPAEFEWFHNGVPISPLLLPAQDQPRVHLNRHMLMVTNTQQRDSGVYQCQAQNQFGRVMAGEYVAVRGIAPVPVGRARGRVQYVVAGSQAILSCDCEAAPEPQVLWRVDGTIVAPGTSRYSYYGGSQTQLQIMPVVASDSGEYSCTAANHWGATTQHITLVVIPHLSVSITNVNPLSHGHLSEGDALTLQCVAEAAVDCQTRCPSLAFTWTFNDRPVAALPQYQSTTFETSATASSIVVPAVDGRMHGVLMCRVDLQHAHATNTFSINLRSRPQPPVRVLVRLQEGNAATLSWMLSPGDMSPVARYRIQARVNNDTHWEDIQGDIISSEHVIADHRIQLVHGLSAYVFRVRMQDKAGQWSLPSQPSQPVHTQSTAPTAAPALQRVHVTRNGSVHVQWTPLKQRDWNDQFVGYRLRWLDLNTNRETLVPMPADATATSYTIDVPGSRNRTGCTPVLVAVAAYNGYGYGPESRTHKVYTPASASPMLPSIYRLAAVNASAINITYQLNIHNMNCVKHRYVLVECTSADERVVGRLPVHGCWGVLTGFAASTSYDCRVQPIGVDGSEGTASQPRSVQTLPAGRVLISELRVAQADMHGVLLSWHTRANGQHIASYKLLISNGLAARRRQEVLIRVSSGQAGDGQHRLRISQLNLHEHYRLQLLALNANAQPLNQQHSTDTVQFTYSGTWQTQSANQTASSLSAVAAPLHNQPNLFAALLTLLLCLYNMICEPS